MRFTEQQYFRQIWIWILSIGINGVFVYGFIQQIYFKKPFGNNPLGDKELLILAVGIFLISIAFVFIRLDTSIDKIGVHYRYFPFQRTMRTISWDRISKSYVRQYSPIGEYGGWGIRIGLFGKGRAFNVSGDNGLQLVYDNEKKFLIGTQKPEDLKKALQELGKN